MIRRAGVAVPEGDIARTTRFNRQRDADDFRVHRIEARRLGIERRQFRRFDCGEPAVKRLLVVDDFVVCFERSLRRGRCLRRRCRVPAATGVIAGGFLGDLAGGVRWRFVGRKIAEPRLEFESLIQLAKRGHIGWR